MQPGCATPSQKGPSRGLGLLPLLCRGKVSLKTVWCWCSENPSARRSVQRWGRAGGLWAFGGRWNLHNGFTQGYYERLGARKFIHWLHTAAGPEVPSGCHTVKPPLEKGLLMLCYHLAYLCHIGEWHNSLPVCNLWGTFAKGNFCYLKNNIKK